jgi:iron-sulfur cluster repair protein YtfE (RIC family)
MAMYTPSSALTELEAQHDALRAMMDRCEQLADELDADRTSQLRLTRELARLRLALDAHNAFEEQLLRSMLPGNDAFADARIERMVQDHIEQHRSIRVRLDSTKTSSVRDVIDNLRAHLDAEGSYLLDATVLRDDLVSVEDAG